MSKASNIIRITVLVLLVVAVSVFCCVRLMSIQIVQGESLRKESESISTGNQVIQAARGEIVDANLKPLAANKVGYNVVVDKAFFPDNQAAQNEIILRVAEILQGEGNAWIDTAPISKTAPYTFDDTRAEDIATLQKTLKQQTYSTAQNCMDAMIAEYEISGSYTEEQKRTIAGVRYEMVLREFTVNNRYVFAQGISDAAVSKVKERSFALQGVDIAQEAIRTYEDGDIAPHILGTVGPISAEEYKELKASDYKLNDTLGKSGIEKWGESYLRGKNGTRTVKQNASGEPISSEVTDPAVPGNTIALTIDATFQAKVQKILEDHIAWLHSPDNKEHKGAIAEGGSIVVLNAKTGAVLAMVNYPNYDINNYYKDYATLAKAEFNPLYNRATMGLYRPGSTFKTVTATAGLTDGIIDRSSTVHCDGVYTYYNDIAPKCTGHHGDISVVHALGVSCNIFFYDVARRLGIDRLADMAHQFGLGVPTGLEIGGKDGHLAGPDWFDTIGQDWTPGQVLQTGIGQSETGVTPMQMAVQAMTLANKGVRYQPHLVKGIYSYDLKTLISETQPAVVSTIENTNGAFDTVKEGMIEVSAYNFPAAHSLQDFPFKVAIKTGSPQVTKDITSSAVVGFAPADDPQIAFAIMVEKGEYAKYMVRDIVDQYFYDGKYAQQAQTTTAPLPQVTQ